ncbi:MAG: aminopeptidase P family protein [Phycisphaerae bacterium]|nr:aminopeptidase P family protein [Phycisphaerae bacterium]
MDEQTAAGRLAGVRRRMRAQNLDALVIMGAENVTYLTGFMGHDSWVLVIGRRAWLITDSRYTEQAESECVGCRIIERRGPIIEAVSGIFGRNRSVKLAGVEDTCPVATYRRLRRGVDVRLKPVAQVVEAVRRCKDPDEVAAITKAAAAAWKALNAALPQLQAGMTERHAAGILEFEMRKLRAAPSFETIMAFGPNGSRNHHQPGERRLKKNDTILIDFGARVGGYCSDTTRCFAFGKAGRLYERVYYGVLAAQKAAIRKMRAGVKLCDVDQCARAVLEERGLPVYGHGTGHGLGLQVHETPFMSKAAKGTLRAGDVVTVEPGVYIPGKLGVRIEDDVLVTETGCRILTQDRRFGFSSTTMPVLPGR